MSLTTVINFCYLFHLFTQGYPVNLAFCFDMEAAAYNVIGGWLRSAEHPVHGLHRGRAYGMAIRNMLVDSGIGTQMVIHTANAQKYYVEQQLRGGWFAGYGHVAEMTTGQVETVRRLFLTEQRFWEGVLEGVTSGY